MEIKRSLKNILVSGGAGFIGGNFIRMMLERRAGFQGRIINFDALTYAGNAASLDGVAGKYGGRYVFEHADIRDRAAVERVFAEYDVDTVVHFAAETHVDRSIVRPDDFVTTNVIGTFTLLEAARLAWRNEDGSMRGDALFHQVSTDEVYGSLGEEGCFSETTAYAPCSPYSASKAGADHLVAAYHHTYGLPVTLSACSNNYGPYQFPEKLIPLMIMNMLDGKALPVYGDGKNVRDWIFVEDHNRAVALILERGRTGEKYNIGGENEWENLKLLDTLIRIAANKTGRDAKEIERTIRFVPDRPGHDRRYAIDCSKIKRELGWRQSVSFEEGLEKTIDWYIENRHNYTAGGACSSNV
ncbi:MAG: dTDP-glucose 4,6-dehydratase [Spirochaetaceae bacterium]|jgi:dTDP-glucose 4,6-dehydratase|nr:dTDP-glucose 4,6-dehydratase [Spirochaetaceae bacterium]